MSGYLQQPEGDEVTGTLDVRSCLSFPMVLRATGFSGRL